MNKPEVLVRAPPADIGAGQEERMCICSSSYANCMKHDEQTRGQCSRVVPIQVQSE
jgi:hypothetical protein